MKSFVLASVLALAATSLQAAPEEGIKPAPPKAPKRVQDIMIPIPHEQDVTDNGCRLRASPAEADERIRTFQADAARRAGIFHHLITLPTYHTAALSTDNLSKDYFGEQGMLGYVKNVQRQGIRQGIACVKHQNMSGSDIGDDHKEYFAGEAALKAGGAANTMNQFAA